MKRLFFLFVHVDLCSSWLSAIMEVWSAYLADLLEPEGACKDCQPVPVGSIVRCMQQTESHCHDSQPTLWGCDSLAKTCHHVSYSLNSLKGLYGGLLRGIFIIGGTKEDTRSLDESSCGSVSRLPPVFCCREELCLSVFKHLKALFSLRGGLLQAPES